MAFNKNKLTLVSQNGVPDAPKLWMYSTADLMNDIRVTDYFLNAIDLLSLNDIIIVNAEVGGGTPKVFFVYVNERTDATIDVVDGLQIPVTDLT